MLTDNRLKIFVAVAETGGFTSAAHSLKMSQPAVSQCVAQLEEEAGGALFLRVKGGVELTPEGRRFYEYSLRILSLYDSLASELAGNGSLPETTRLPIAGGRSVNISVHDSKIEIDLN
ncbi:MAG: LysR family transcriptional regulator [Bacteroidales bacterium]|nr:LysR family transcriptional regulator [Bacteroidales bacterium]